MKCDDDTFVKVETILKLVRENSTKQSLYMGNMNYYHQALRHGKWAVTREVCSPLCPCQYCFLRSLADRYPAPLMQEWSGEVYPPYAQGGPGYVISADIARFILAKKEEENLRVRRCRK